ncbi:MAG: H/ACA snoRNP pseudouridylase subunit [Bogoriella megaspora]|nr:MAG: H/ACA snoRNP pseudouridylase subunit [Bogoriella megaspora]
MSGFRGGRGGRGDRGGFGNFRGGGSGRGRGGFQQSYGPPATVQEMGAFLHPCEGEIVCSSINAKIPHFNAPIFLENKTQIGKVEEVFGPINQVHFTIKTQDGIQATSFKPGDKFYIGDEKLLPLERFLPKPKPALGTQVPQNRRKQSAIEGVVEEEVAGVDLEVGEELQGEHQGVVEAVLAEALALVAEEVAVEVDSQVEEVVLLAADLEAIVAVADKNIQPAQGVQGVCGDYDTPSCICCSRQGLTWKIMWKSSDGRCGCSISNYMKVMQ